VAGKKIINPLGTHHFHSASLGISNEALEFGFSCLAH